MANPLTAIEADVNESIVSTFLQTIITKKDVCEITLLSRGSYGFVFKIRLIEVMDEQIDSPFKTFTIDSNGALTYTYENTFCCKLVPIFEPSITIRIHRSGNPDIEQHTSTRISFNNECNKQRQIYALTNHNLNSVCLPLFYFNIVNLSTDSIFKDIVNFIFVKTGITVTGPVGLEYGISFMPFTPNIHTTDPISGTTPSTIVYLAGAGAIENIKTSIGESYSQYQLDETRIIEIFQRSLFMYPFVSVVSLLMRLYSIGYCHGDLHAGNIVVYPANSGMTRNGQGNIIYFGPTYSLIDTGFAYKHDQPVPADLLSNYESFKRVINDIITRKVKKLGNNMLTYPPYNWFPQVFMDNIESPNPILNNNSCDVIFNLLQYYTRYRENLEQHKLAIFNSLWPGQLDYIRTQNHTISESVVAYIRSLESYGNPLQLFNVYGGRRISRSRSYRFTHKKTNKRRRSKKHRRKSYRRYRK